MFFLFFTRGFPFPFVSPFGWILMRRSGNYRYPTDWTCHHSSETDSYFFSPLCVV